MTNAELQSDDPTVVGINHIELYVSNNYQAAHFYRYVLGFETADSPGLNDVRSDQCSVVIKQRDITLVLTAPLEASSVVAEHIRVHGEGIRDIALAVTGLDSLFETAIHKGARAVMSPATQNNSSGPHRTACIGVFGDIVHTLVERPKTDHWCPPTSVAHTTISGLSDAGLESIDHVALALSAGELDTWITFYSGALGFREIHDEQVSTNYSAMRSKVVQSANGSVRFPMMEPVSGRRKSQIEHYIESHEGPGAQHLAFRSNNIIKSVAMMAAAGLEFLSTPHTYYDGLEARVGELPGEMDTLRRLGVLVDRDSGGLLLQIFTKPIGARQTLFMELIERRGAQGFGSGNIRALYEAVERAQTAASST